LPTFSLHDDEGTPREYIPDAKAVHPEKAAIYSDQQAQIESMLNELNELDRAAIVLRYWHDASEVEIAETLDLTVSAVKSRLHRARRKLGELWKEDPQPSQNMERMPYGSPAF
jgi:RNA polymerase sigma-70 factor (ECF subfamily)